MLMWCYGLCKFRVRVRVISMIRVEFGLRL